MKSKKQLEKSTCIRYRADELLLICARSALTIDLKNSAISLIGAGVFWEDFVTGAIQGGVTVLVFNSLKNLVSYGACIPGFVFERLKTEYLRVLLNATYQYRETIGLLKLFADEGVPVVPLKGAFLSKRIYGDIAARGMSVDIDLLVEDRNKERAWRLLESNGYSPDIQQEVNKWQYEQVFDKPKKILLELHWDIWWTMLVKDKKRIKGLWEGVRLTEDGGVKYYEFKEEELLLYLCSHVVASDVRGKFLRYICDINELVLKYGQLIDWDSLVEKAKEWRLDSSLYICFTLSKELLGSPVPNEVLKKVRPVYLKMVFIRLFTNREFVLTDRKRSKIIGLFLGNVFFELVEAKTIPEYFYILFRRILFPPKEIMQGKCYAARFLRGLSKYFLSLPNT